MTSVEQKIVLGKRNNGNFNSDVDIRSLVDDEVVTHLESKIFSKKRRTDGVTTKWDERSKVLTKTTTTGGEKVRTIKLRSSKVGLNSQHTGNFLSCLGEQDKIVFKVVKKLFNPKTVLKIGDQWKKQQKDINSFFTDKFDMESFKDNLKEIITSQSDYIYVVSEDDGSVHHSIQSSLGLYQALVKDLHSPMILNKGRTLRFSSQLKFKRKGVKYYKEGQLWIQGLDEMCISRKIV